MGNKIGDAGMSALAGAFASGALDTLQKLYLGRCSSIGDAGMSALADALSSGALASLQTFYVPSGHERHPALVAACKPRDITIQYF